MAIGMPEVIVVLIIVLILFGPKRLPQLARSIGKSVREYKKGMADDEVKQKGKKSKG